jgi:L-fuconolactonase
MKSIQTEATASNSAHRRPNEAWLSLAQEDVLEPQLAVIDSHHHLWDRPGNRYLLQEFLDDLACGHDVQATVHAECGAMYRAKGPREFKPVGETEFINGMAAIFASGNYGATRACAGIVGFADLLLGDPVKGVLEAHIAAGGGRFRGVRNIAAWHADETFVRTITIVRAPERMLQDETFQAGFRHLAPLGLLFETYLFHTQLDDVYALARKFEDTRIVLNFFGGPIKIGPYQGRDEEVFAQWHAGIRKLAACPNVYMKMGGLTVHTSGLNYRDAKTPPSSEQLARPWHAYVDASIAAFGADRCFFGTNFPVEKQSCSARVCWNSLKRLAASCTPEEKVALFTGTAAKLYRLED